MYWGGHLLALKEVALPYGVDPFTLNTTCYDPFPGVKSKTFTAHPKYDPYEDKLIVFGYEAKVCVTVPTTDLVMHSGADELTSWLHRNRGLLRLTWLRILLIDLG